MIERAGEAAANQPIGNDDSASRWRRIARAALLAALDPEDEALLDRGARELCAFRNEEPESVCYQLVMDGVSSVAASTQTTNLERAKREVRFMVGWLRLSATAQGGPTRSPACDARGRWRARTCAQCAPMTAPD